MLAESAERLAHLELIDKTESRSGPSPYESESFRDNLKPGFASYTCLEFKGQKNYIPTTLPTVKSKTVEDQ